MYIEPRPKLSSAGSGAFYIKEKVMEDSFGYKDTITSIDPIPGQSIQQAYHNATSRKRRPEEVD